MHLHGRNECAIKRNAWVCIIHQSTHVAMGKVTSSCTTEREGLRPARQPMHMTKLTKRSQFLSLAKPGRSIAVIKLTLMGHVTMMNKLPSQT